MNSPFLITLKRRFLLCNKMKEVLNLSVTPPHAFSVNMSPVVPEARETSWNAFQLPHVARAFISGKL